ncbi:hypothetical protein D3C71_89630 [compost metagenome]
MEKNEYKDLAEKLRMLFYQKGYRRKFTLSVPGSGLPKQMDDLRKCLEVFKMLLDVGKASFCQLELETTAPYNDRITCRFKLDYSESNGINIRELEVRSLETNNIKVFQIRSNHEIPGSMTLESLFPKPKPWDYLKRGKFRP